MKSRLCAKSASANGVRLEIRSGIVSDILDQGRSAAERKCAARNGVSMVTRELDRANRASVLEARSRSSPARRPITRPRCSCPQVASRIDQQPDCGLCVSREFDARVKTWNKFRRMQPFLRATLCRNSQFAATVHNMDTKAAGAAIAARERASNQFRQLRSVMKPAGQWS
jgi:hypothetical protein